MRVLFSTLPLLSLSIAACGSGASSGAPPESAPRGTLSRAAIRSVISEHVGEVRACYERGLARDPELRGRLTVAFIVQRDGSVRAATIESGLEQDVDNCIVTRISGWRFPHPDGGGDVGVRYPFVFDSEQSEHGGDPDAP